MTEFPEEGMTLRGRFFSAGDLRLIRSLVEENYARGRTQASVEICRALDWRQPNGWLKDRACRDVLLKLEQLALVVLPPKKSNPVGNRRRTEAYLQRKPEICESSVTRLGSSEYRVDMVKGSHLEGVWNAYMAEHHYRGFRVLVGKSLKYLVRGRGTVIGAAGFSDSAWSLAPRDDLLEGLGVHPEEIRAQTVSNSRFLISPWVTVPNLASRLLSTLISRVKVDWTQFYNLQPRFLETFVEVPRFVGTCYLAANWIPIGTTKGYLKRGSVHSNSQSPKKVLLYPLRPRDRRAILEVLR